MQSKPDVRRPVGANAADGAHVSAKVGVCGEMRAQLRRVRRQIAALAAPQTSARRARGELERRRRSEADACVRVRQRQ